MNFCPVLPLFFSLFHSSFSFLLLLFFLLIKMDSDDDHHRDDDDAGEVDQIVLDFGRAKKKATEAAVHLIPCEIHHDGEAKVLSSPSDFQFLLVACWNLPISCQF